MLLFSFFLKFSPNQICRTERLAKLRFPARPAGGNAV